MGDLRAQLKPSIAASEDTAAAAPLDYIIELGQTHWKLEPGAGPYSTVWMVISHGSP